MKEIINQMRRICASKCDEYGIKDFETYTVPSVEKTNEPFFFGVRPSGTTFESIGNTEMQSYFRNCVRRFQLFREPTLPIYSILYYKNWNDYSVYFFDGYVLNPIAAFEDIEKIYFNIWGVALNELMRDYATEYKIRNDKLELKILSDRVEHIRKVAKALCSNSVEECIENLISRPRFSTRHWVEIYGDFGLDLRWYRCYINDKGEEITDIHGGICFHEAHKDRQGDYHPAYWSIHT